MKKGLIEKYVSNLELSKELKDLGVKQKSEFYWIRLNGVKEFLVFSKNQIKEHDKPFYKNTSKEIVERYPAFLVGELGEMLPTILDAPDGNTTERLLTNFQEEEKWTSGYAYTYIEEGGGFAVFDFEQKANTEANSRTLLLIYLIKNKLIKVKDL